MPRTKNADRRAQIVALAEGGMPADEIARRYNMTVSGVGYHLRAARLDRETALAAATEPTFVQRLGQQMEDRLAVLTAEADQLDAERRRIAAARHALGLDRG